MKTAMKSELRTAPHWAQGWSEDGPYDYQKGWVVEARTPCEYGDSIYTYQKRFFSMGEYNEAEDLIDSLCGNYSNAFWCNIDTESDDWMLTGASY